MLAIEKYNVRHAWGSVATQIVHELEKEFKPAQFSIVNKTKLWFIEQAFLTKYHGFSFSINPYIPKKMKRAMKRAMKRFGL